MSDGDEIIYLLAMWPVAVAMAMVIGSVKIRTKQTFYSYHIKEN
jgi:hypothetical protein